MKKFSLKGLVSGLASRPAEPAWQPADRPYPRLRTFMPPADVAGQSGIYAVWHLGVRPQWLRIGAAADLGACLKHVAGADWIPRYEDNGGVFAAWFPAAPEQSAGMARFLVENLKPAHQQGIFAGEKTSEGDVPALACPFPPGTEP